VVFVSHTSETIRKICSKALWLDHGETRMYGDVNDVINAYDAYCDSI